jgi:hypothetical protein
LSAIPDRAVAQSHFVLGWSSPTLFSVTGTGPGIITGVLFQVLDPSVAQSLELILDEPTGLAGHAELNAERYCTPAVFACQLAGCTQLVSDAVLKLGSITIVPEPGVTICLASALRVWRGAEPSTDACEEVDDAIWTIIYYNTILGRIDLKTGMITGN